MTPLRPKRRRRRHLMQRGGTRDVRLNGGWEAAICSSHELARMRFAPPIPAAIKNLTLLLILQIDLPSVCLA